MSGVGPFHADYVRPAHSVALARNWWAVLIRGLLAIVFGIIALAEPGAALGALILLFGAYMAVDGIFAIIAGVRAAAHHERWLSLIVEGILGLIAAAIAFTYPLLTIFALVIFAAVWAVLSGIALLAGAFRLHGAHGRWLMAFGGVVSIVWGILLYINPPIGALVMTYWLGAYALIFGIAMVALAFRLRRGLAG